jgi:hypothetical protein
MDLLKICGVRKIKMYETRINKIYEKTHKLRSEKTNMSPHIGRKKHISTETETDGLLEKEK